MKRTIKLTESDLHRIILESVKMAINEIGDTPDGQYDLGRAAGRRYWRSINSDDQKTAQSNGDYSDTIASHAALNASNLEDGKEFDYGFEDVMNYMKNHSN